MIVRKRLFHLGWLPYREGLDEYFELVDLAGWQFEAPRFWPIAEMRREQIRDCR